MKVAYLLGSLSQGGTETLLLDVFNSSQMAHFGIIGIYRKEGLLSESFHASKVSVFRLTPGRSAFLLIYLWRLRKLFKREKVEIIHAQQSLDAVYARLASFGLSVKVVQTLHSFDFGLGYFSKMIIRLSFKMADTNIFVSKTQLKHYLSTYKMRQNMNKVVVYNGIDFEKFNKPVENTIRTKLGIYDNSLLLGMVGNFVNGRDHLTICRFLDLLNKKGVKFTFLFIGKKDDRNPLIYDNCRIFCEKNKLSDKVIFLGSRSDVPALLPQLDAFIYSTDHDTFGLAVIEAIASGTSVFTNDWEVMKEITEEGKRVILYRTRDENDLLNKFLFYFSQPESIRKSTRENALWAQKVFSIKEHIDQLTVVYRGRNLSNVEEKRR